MRHQLAWTSGRSQLEMLGHLGAVKVGRIARFMVTGSPVVWKAEIFLPGAKLEKTTFSDTEGAATAVEMAVGEWMHQAGVAKR